VNDRLARVEMALRLLAEDLLLSRELGSWTADETAKKMLEVLNVSDKGRVVASRRPGQA
jgi:hypothetical protein